MICTSVCPTCRRRKMFGRSHSRRGRCCRSEEHRFTDKIISHRCSHEHPWGEVKDGARKAKRLR